MTRPTSHGGAVPPIESSDALATLDHVLARMDDGYVEVDENWRITRVNRRAAEHLHVAADELVGRELWQALRPEPGSAAEGELRRALEQRVPVRVDMQPLQGQRRIDLRAFPRGTGLSLFLRDVTGRFATEQALRRSEELHGVIVSQVRDYAIFSADVDGRITSWNEGCLRVLGYAEEEFLGRDSAMLFLSEDRAAGIPGLELRQAAEHGSAGNDRWMMRRDGRSIWVMGITTALRADDGSLVGYTKVMRDQTDWKVAQEALRRSEERFRVMADSAPVMIWVAGVDQACTWRNRPWLEFVGRTLQEEVGHGWIENLHPDDVEACRRTYAAAVAEHRPFKLEYRVRRHDGEYRWVLDNGVPLWDSAGELTGYIGSCVDISEQKGVQVALQDEHRRKDEFLAILAHELRNPLAPIRMSIHLLRRKSAELDVDRLYEMIDRQAAHLARLVDDLLEVSRITRGKIELRKGTVPLGDVITSALETAHPLFRAGGQHLDVRIPEESLVLEADGVRLAQVFANLLNNAAKFTPPGGRVSLEARRDGDKALVTVRDTGRGIAPELLPHVFDLFTQGTVDGGNRGGLGIGLTLARRLVEMHGGSIEAHSEGVGKGATFHVRLPLHGVEAPRPEPQAPPADAPRVSQRPRRVLVVDDNKDAAESLGLLVRGLGHETCTAFDAGTALDATRAFGPDVALLDIGLPDMSGYELARRIRAARGDKDIKLIAVTGWGQESDRRRSDAAGFDLHLVKPVDPNALMDALAGEAEAH